MSVDAKAQQTVRVGMYNTPDFTCCKLSNRQIADTFAFCNINGQENYDRQEAGNPTARESGGICKYKVYKGSAKIISIRKKDMSGRYGGPSYESYEVKFSFSTDEEIKEALGKVEGNKYLLTLRNSWYPGKKFLGKYGIKEGRSYDCYLNVITKGACTPVYFDFTDIDLSDYFETKNSR